MHTPPRSRRRRRNRPPAPAPPAVVSDRTPIPASIEIHNVFPPLQLMLSSSQSAGNDSPARRGDTGREQQQQPLTMMMHQRPRHQRHEYSVDLLHEVMLEIVVYVNSSGSGTCAAADGSGREEEENTGAAAAAKVEKVLYTGVARPRKTVCPCWQHLNEHVVVASELTIDEYESMIARFSIVATTNGVVVDDDGRGCRDNGAVIEAAPGAAAAAAAAAPPSASLDADTAVSTSSECSTVFLEVPIHPSRLITIERKPEAGTMMPLNAVVLTFNDESTRVPQSLFQLIGSAANGSNRGGANAGGNNNQSSFENGQAAQQQQSGSGGGGGGGGGMVNKSFDSDYSRFEDDVFRTLDQVTPIWNDDSSLLDDEDRSSGDDATLDVPDLLTSSAHKQKDLCSKRATIAVAESSNGSRNEGEAGTAGNEEEESVGIIRQDLIEEQLLLKQLLREEMDALEMERTEVVEARDRLKELSRRHRTCEEQTAQVVDATKQVDLEYHKAAFMLQSQRIILIRDLRTIYPITVTFLDSHNNSASSSGSAQMRYKIRGLELPHFVADSILVSGTVAEDELTAAIGCLCHLVAMMSKYLSVQLRYRVFCHASRSAIRDDRGVMYPLFLPGRSVVERERFETGVRMLVRNVDCICAERGIRVSPKLHVLGKVKRVYEHVVDGC